MSKHKGAFEHVFWLMLLLIAGGLLLILSRQQPQPEPEAWTYRDIVIGPHREPHGLYRRIAGNAYEQLFDYHKWRHAGAMFVDSPPPEPIMLHERRGGAVLLVEERLTIHYGDYIYQVCWRDGELAQCGHFVETWHTYYEDWVHTESPAGHIEWIDPEIVEQQRWTLD